MRKEKSSTLEFIKTGSVEIPNFKAAGNLVETLQLLTSALSPSNNELVEAADDMPIKLLTASFLLGQSRGTKSISAESVARSASGLAANPSASPSTRLPNVGTAAIVKPGSATVPTVPPASIPGKYQILEQYMALQGVQKTRYWDANKAMIIRDMQDRNREEATAKRATTENAHAEAVAKNPIVAKYLSLTGDEKTSFFKKYQTEIGKSLSQ